MRSTLKNHANLALRGALLLAISGACALFNPVTAEAATPTPTPEEWQLAIRPGPLRIYEDPTTGERYWYFVYRVTNRTTADRMFAPRIEMFTDKGEIIRSGSGIDSDVSRRLRGHLSDPLLEDENKIIGDIKLGREHAKDGLVIWLVTDENLLDEDSVNQVAIFVGGLSNQSKQIEHPVTGDPVRMRRTLRLDYFIPGNAAARGTNAALPDTRPLTRQRASERAIAPHNTAENGVWIWR